MLTMPQKELQSLTAVLARMEDDYQPWKSFHKDLADFILPMRYSWLNETSGISQTRIRANITSNRNKLILDSTGTKAARDLAAGMLNGVTSPARPWFNLRFRQFFAEGQTPIELQRWIEEVRRRMFIILAESNFYNSMAGLLLDLCVFGTAGMLVYEDFDDVIRCYNLPVGEFRLAQDARRHVSTISRLEVLTVEQVVQQFGLENCTYHTQEKYKKGGAELYHGIRVGHLIEPNREDGRFIKGGTAYREFYWELGQNPKNQILQRAIYNEKPGCFPRWEVVGNDTYGLSPGMDALPDIIQLQHETVRKAEGIDMMTNPPMVLDAALRNKGGGTQPGARIYVPSYSQVGAKAAFQTNLNLGELTADIREVQQRIRDAFFNDLFRMISQLQTVRSATEIDARREEKLVLMGAVLERLENEALDPVMARIFGIMKRKGQIPELPEGFEEIEVEIQYVSILSDAQRSVGTGVIERFMQAVGQTVALVPSVKNVVNWDGIMREYANRLNVPPSGINSLEEAAAIAEGERQMLEAQQAAQVGQQLTSAAKNLGDTDIGGGRNAFQELLGG